MNFEAYAIACGFLGALTAGGEMMLPEFGEVEDQTTSEGTAKMRTKRRMLQQ